MRERERETIRLSFHPWNTKPSTAAQKVFNKQIEETGRWNREIVSYPKKEKERNKKYKQWEMFWVVLIVCGMPIAIACETSWSFPSPPLIGRDGCVYILESCSTTVTPRKVFNPYYQISNGRDGRRSRRKHVYPILFFLSFLQLVISLGCNSLMTEQRTQDFDEECLVPFPSTRRSSSSS